MKIILAPAKKMNQDTDSLAPLGLPVYLYKTEEILSWLKSKSHEELQEHLRILSAFYDGNAGYYHVGLKKNSYWRSLSQR